jgi:hypothetical protein
MNPRDPDPSRRAVLAGLVALGAASIGRSHAYAAGGERLGKPIPAPMSSCP